MLVVIATKDELPLVEKLGYKNKPILITGVGGVNVIKALQNVPKTEYIVNIGYAGSNTLEIGETVEVSYVQTYHETAQFYEDVYKYLGGKFPCYTSTDFVTKTEIEQPCLFDMELAFIVAMGFDNIRAIKVVSDNLNLKQYNKTIKETKNGKI